MTNATANAGPDQVVAAGDLVILDGTASTDPNGLPLSYSWSQTGGPSVFLGYVDGADTAAAFEGEWYRTGDLVEVHDGRIIVTGRLTEVVNRNGLKISLGELDAAITGLPGARDRVVDIIEHRTRIAAEHYILAIVGQDDLSPAFQRRATYQDLEITLVSGRINGNCASVIDRTAERQDRTIADRHRDGIR